MNKTVRYILIILGIILTGFILWYFKSIVIYIIASLILSLMGRPVVQFLGKIRIGKFILPKALRAFLGLIVLWVSFFTFFRIFIPLIAQEANSLSQINIQKLISDLNDPILRIEHFINDFKLTAETSLETYLTNKMMSILNISLFSNLFSTLASLLGNIFVAIFAISFITFFFLRDEKLFAESILLLIPDKNVESFRHALSSIRRLLMRYFIGIMGEVTGIIILVTIGLTIVGVGFRHSLLIGLLAGILNIIPYLGPLIGASLGVFLGMATHLNLNFYHELLPLAGYMIIVFSIVQVIDNILFQPLIYSSSVQAHPLEIFLVILIAGSMAGIVGMIVAIPSYTILRVFAKEFFNKFKVIKKLTENIP
jgi:predicted PurR-regulated permease PerM